MAGAAREQRARRSPAGGRRRRWVRPDAQGQGLGRSLCDDLLGRLVDNGLHLALAAVALPNPASLALHRACGFDEVGVMREVGRKLDRWVDVLWLQRLLVR